MTADRRDPAALLALLALFFLLFPAAAVPLGPSPLAEEVRRRVEAGCTPIESAVGIEIVCASAGVRSLYSRRGFEPVWVGPEGLLPVAETLVRTLAAAPAHGLRAQDYHLAAVRERAAATRARADPLQAHAELEILLTDAFLLFGAHLLAGRVDAERIHPDWLANPRAIDVVPALERALASGRVAEELAALAPEHPEYGRLRGALARYRDFAEVGWPAVGEGPPLRLGDRGPRVSELRARLAAEGASTAAEEADDALDDLLEQALRTFQTRHGLAPDGVVGPETLGALNVSAAERVRQLEVNLERWRWLPRELGARHIRVDVASFRLDAIEAGRPVLSMAVVVGKPYTATPVFSSRFTAVVVNPSWRVPRSIAAGELLTEVRKDPSYLQREGYRVFRGETEVDPRRVAWASLSPGRLGLRFVQAPGPKNALGRVKFVLPNRFDVYLHDTPARSLFSQTRRAFSHGCIRLEKPLELAQYLLRDDPRWRRGALLGAIAAGREQTVPLRTPVPVHLLYSTAWVAEDGTVYFGEDLYGRDGPTAEALEAPAPGRDAPAPAPPP